MKNGNTMLYVIIGAVAVAIVGFLVVRNRSNDAVETSEQTVTVAEEATESLNTSLTMEDSIAESSNGMILVSEQIIISPEEDIIENLTSSSDLTTLVATLKSSGVEDSLKADGPFTVFAPTNDAFKKLPEESLQELTKPENQADLTKILMLHVVPGEFPSSTIAEGIQLKTASGETLTFTKKNGQWWINDTAIVQQVDGNATNGVIYVIDTVMLPKE